VLLVGAWIKSGSEFHTYCYGGSKNVKKLLVQFEFIYYYAATLDRVCKSGARVDCGEGRADEKWKERVAFRLLLIYETTTALMCTV